MELQAVVDHFLGDIRGKQLGHGDLQGGVVACDEFVDRVVGQHPRGTDRREVFGELVLPDLELDDGTVEGPTLIPERNRVLNRNVHSLHCHQRPAQSLTLEVLHDVDEATVENAQQITLWNSTVIEVNL